MTNSVDRFREIGIAEFEFDFQGEHYWQFTTLYHSFTLLASSKLLQHLKQDLQAVLIEIDVEPNIQKLNCCKVLPDCVDAHFMMRSIKNAAPHISASVEKLWCAFANISMPHLQRFFYDFLQMEQVVHDFCQAKASYGNHHDYQGGLFDHSYEVAKQSALSCQQHNLGRHAIETAFIGGLFHDIGKTMMFYNDKDNVNIHHETANFILLGKLLEQLKADSPLCFEALSACLNIHNKNNKDHFGIAKIISQNDLISSELNMKKKAFSGKPDSFHFIKSADNKLHKRLG